MKTATKNSMNSKIYERIGTIRISAAERATAIAAMQEGEEIAQAVLNAAHVLRLLVSMPNLKPSLRH